MASTSLRLFISLTLLGLTSAYPLHKHPLHIDQLENLVMGPDKRLLDALDDDEYSPRSELKEKFDVILERQSEKIKKAYADEVELLEKRRHHWEDIRRSNLHIEDRPIYDEIRTIRADLTLSFHMVEKRERELWLKIEHNERMRNAMHDSDSGSHSDEDFDD